MLRKQVPRNLYLKYKDNVNKNSSFLNSANKRINGLKIICNSITKYSDYDSPCLMSCFDLHEELKKLKDEYLLSGGAGSCGFSERLILWIANIVRWVKYIVPVAVIVLGILDFIKAIGADKEDVMKKAQQRFIKSSIFKKRFYRRLFNGQT